LRFSFFGFEPTNKVLRIWLGFAFTRRIKFDPALADRTELAVKTGPNSRAPIERRGYFTSAARTTPER
jgi:hypothetical protein